MMTRLFKTVGGYIVFCLFKCAH